MRDHKIHFLFLAFHQLLRHWARLCPCSSLFRIIFLLLKCTLTTVSELCLWTTRILGLTCRGLMLLDRIQMHHHSGLLVTINWKLFIISLAYHHRQYLIGQEDWIESYNTYHSGVEQSKTGNKTKHDSMQYLLHQHTAAWKWIRDYIHKTREGMAESQKTFSYGKLASGKRTTGRP